MQLLEKRREGEGGAETRGREKGVRRRLRELKGQSQEQGAAEQRQSTGLAL